MFGFCSVGIIGISCRGEGRKSIFRNAIVEKSNGQGSRENFTTTCENCGKVKISQGVAIDKAARNYVVICEFTWVAAICCEIYVKSSTSECHFRVLPRMFFSGSRLRIYRRIYGCVKMRIGFKRRVLSWQASPTVPEELIAYIAQAAYI